MDSNKNIGQRFESGWILAICALALYLRWPISGLAWSHVDERAFVLYPLGFWAGDLNPYFFNYPTFHLYITSALYYLYYLLFSPNSLDYFVAYHYLVDGTALLPIPRTLNALLSVGTVFVCWRIAHRLYATSGGLVAAALLAVLPLHTRFAYLAITDVPAAFWSTCAVFFAVRLLQEGRRRDLLIGSLCAGIAAASKYPAGLCLVAVLAAALFDKRRDTWIAPIAALLTFALASPYVWLDYDAFIFDLIKMSKEHLVNANHDRAISPWAHWLSFNLRHGMGWIPLATLLAALAGWRKNWSREELVILITAAAFAVLLGASSSVFMRYGLALIPLLAVLIVRPLVLSARRLPTVFIGSWCLLLWAEPLMASLQARQLLNKKDTRLQATEFLDRDMPHVRRIIQIPKGAGQLPLLRAKSVYVRAAAFAKSYGEEGLLKAYQLLAAGPALPPLYVEWVFANYNQIDRLPQAPQHVLVLHYIHPLCGMSPIDLSGQQQSDAQAEWVYHANPGNVHAALFDPIDWHFLPVGKWQHVEATGPQIRIGKLPLSIAAELPSSHLFFSLLASTIAGRQAVRDADWSTAERHYTAVVATHSIAEFLPPTDIYQTYLGLGLAYKNLGDSAQAKKNIAQAIQIRPDWEDAHFELAILLDSLGDYAAALDHYAAVLKHSPDDADVLFNMGLSLIKMHRYEDSVHFLERAALAAPSAETYLQLATLYGHLDRLDDAQRASEHLRQLAPDRIENMLSQRQDP